MSLPKFLQSALWSYDISKMDVKEDKDKTVIIYHLLNFGNLKQIKWLFANVKKIDIEKVLKNPWRGSWNPKSLNFWLNLFKVKILKNKFNEAEGNIYPKFTINL